MVGLNSKGLSPQLTIGNNTFLNFNYTVAKYGKDDQHMGILGNDILKRFNVILDNKNGHIYLKPNSLFNEPYTNPEYYLVRIIGIVLVLSIAFAAFFRYKKIQQLKLTKNYISNLFIR